MNGLREKLFAYVKKKYRAAPEFLWERFPDYAVFRHRDSGKWFAAVMPVPRVRLGLEGEGSAEIVNVKTDDPVFAYMLRQQPGYLKAYHMAHGNWISVLLDGTVPFGDVCARIDESYLVTASKGEKKTLLPPKDWVVPANPAYYDIVHAFDTEPELLWKQGKGIRKGDTVYMYIGAPVSAILYKCLVKETDIPCKPYRGEKLTVTSLMRLRLVKRYPPEEFTFTVLGEFGVRAVRGPRGIPERLKKALG